MRHGCCRTQGCLSLPPTHTSAFGEFAALGISCVLNQKVHVGEISEWLDGPAMQTSLPDDRHSCTLSHYCAYYINGSNRLKRMYKERVGATYIRQAVVSQAEYDHTRFMVT